MAPGDRELLLTKNRRYVLGRALSTMPGLLLIQALVKERGREARNRSAYLIGRKAWFLKGTQDDRAEVCSVTTVADTEVEHQVIPSYPIVFSAVSRTCPDADDTLPWACDIPSGIPSVIVADLVYNQLRPRLKNRPRLGAELASGYPHDPTTQANEEQKPADNLSGSMRRQNRLLSARSQREQIADDKQRAPRHRRSERDPRNRRRRVPAAQD
jgi:hypothetical protein